LSLRNAGKPRLRLRTLLVAVAACALASALVIEGPRWWQRREQQRRLRETLTALDRPVTLRLAAPTTLLAGLKAFKQFAPNPALPIYVDPVGLGEAGVSINTPVSLDVRGVPLGEAMTRLLKPLGLTHYVDTNRQGLVVITSEASSDRPRAD
jgi:hypothetical protein